MLSSPYDNVGIVVILEYDSKTWKNTVHVVLNFVHMSSFY